MSHEFDYEKIDYESSNYELDVWSSCFNPIFNPPPSVIEEWNRHMVDKWDEPEPELQDTAVYFTDDGIEYLAFVLFKHFLSKIQTCLSICSKQFLFFGFNQSA